jgi:PAS domain S-box-containing protein
MTANKVEENKANVISKHNYISKYKILREAPKNSHLLFLEAMFVGIIAALIIEKFFWWKYTGVTHSILELVCIVSNMSLFFIVWSKYKDSPTSSRIIAFGLLATSIFDVIHIFYFEPLALVAGGAVDLAPRFWILGRLTEVIVIFTASLNFNPRSAKLNRMLGALVAIVLSVTKAYLMISHGDIFPILYDDNGLTSNKIILELIIVILAIVSLLRHKRKVKERGYISYKYLALALAAIIPMEICFMLYKTYVSSIMVYGHVFRVIYCYFLYKSIFESSIEHTYNELEQSRRRLKDILDAIPIGIHTFDRDLKLDFANRESEKLLGFQKEQVTGLSSYEFYNSFKCEDTKGSIIKQLVSENKNYAKVVTKIKKENGEKIKLYFEGRRLEDGYILTAKDAAKEQEINNLHIQTYTILNSMQSPAFICDNEYKIISVNKSFQELMGLHYKDILKLQIRDLLQLINYKSKKSTELNTIDINIEQFEVEFTSAYGEKKEVIANLSNIMNVNGDAIGKICVITDITELKKQQEKILHNEKLALLGQMGATIVHETRNFLTTIKGCSQLIEIMATDERIAKYASKININTDEVNLIISDFLSLSKPKQAITEEIAACDLLKSIESTLSTSSLIKDVHIEFTDALDERYILCDETHMIQVVLNICKNAIEAMEQVPKPKLFVETGIKEDDNGIFIRISDNGKGMNKETLEKIGTAFFTTKQSGTGLGLSVCFDIVKQHGGNIEVTSEVGVGTTFTINLPGLVEDEFEEVV